MYHGLVSTLFVLYDMHGLTLPRSLILYRYVF